MKKGLIFGLLFLVLCFFPVIPALGEEFPSKPINILIGYAAGGSTDLSVRALAVEAAKIFKQPIICTNQVGASGTLVLGRVKGEKNDGYTFITPRPPISAASRIFSAFPTIP